MARRMDLDNVTILAAFLLALVLLVMYFVASARERGTRPSYAREVYLRSGSSALAQALAQAPPSASAYATVAQVAAYAAAGGDATGYGEVADGRCARLGSGAGLVFADRSPYCGMWVYGPKPRRGDPDVAPFSRDYWFQP